MLPRIQDARLWRAVRGLYMGSGALFLVNIIIGVLNVFTPGDIPHAQTLAHFHAATIGWVTLSVIATALWMYTGDRTVTDTEVLWARIFAWLGTIAVVGYVAAFWLAFSGTATFALLPLFGTPTALVIWGAFGFVWAHLKDQHVVTTAHVLLFCALLVVSIGAAMGILWGLTYSAGISPYGDTGDGLGAHAAPMDMYLALAFAAIVETLVRRDHHGHWTRPGMAQAVLGTLGGLLAVVALFVGIEPLIPVGMLAFLVAFGFYIGRTGWRTFKVNPAGGGRNPAVFFGGLFFPVYIVLFVVAVMVYFVPGRPMPHPFEVAFAHITFIGMATNLLLAQHSAFTDGSPLCRPLEPWGVWLLNVGMVLFLVGEFIAERREGALVQAIGALLALGTVWYRMLKAEPPSKPPATHGHMDF